MPTSRPGTNAPPPRACALEGKGAGLRPSYAWRTGRSVREVATKGHACARNGSSEIATVTVGAPSCWMLGYYASAHGRAGTWPIATTTRSERSLQAPELLPRWQVVVKGMRTAPGPAQRFNTPPVWASVPTAPNCEWPLARPPPAGGTRLHRARTHSREKAWVHPRSCVRRTRVRLATVRAGVCPLPGGGARARATAAAFATR